MACNCIPYADAYGGQQTVAQNNLVQFDAVNIESCNTFLENNAIVAPKMGKYSINFNASGTGETAATDCTIQLFNNGLPIPGALATVNLPADSKANFPISTLLDVRHSCACVDNTARITAKVTSANSAVLDNVKLTVIRVEA